jgi:hypothetical protein
MQDVCERNGARSTLARGNAARRSPAQELQ